MERMKVDGLEVAFERRGTGPPLVLLHGFVADGRIFRQQLADLADAFTVVVCDLPGAGQSPDPPESFRMREFAHCLAAFLAGLGVDETHLLGQSWGGVLAQEFYRYYPKRVRSLILVDTYAGWRGSFSEEIVQARLAGCVAQSEKPPAEFVPDWMPDLFTAGASSELQAEMIGIMADFHPGGWRTMTRAVAESDTRAVLPTINVPTVLIWGDDDRRSPVDAVARPIAAVIPGARLEVIGGGGHCCMMEQPVRFNALVRDFLNEIERG